MCVWKCSISNFSGKELCTKFAQEDRFVSYFELTIITNGGGSVCYCTRSVRFYSLKHIGASATRVTGVTNNRQHFRATVLNETQHRLHDIEWHLQRHLEIFIHHQKW